LRKLKQYFWLKTLNYYLITADDKVKEFAEKEGVKVIVL
jgi:hypothetical protein